MGLDTINDWSGFDNAIADLRAQPGVFADEAERARVIGAVQGAIAHEASDAKKMKMAGDFIELVEGGFSMGGLTKLFPFLAGVV